MNEYTIVISDSGRHDQGYKRSQAFWWIASWFGGYAELGLYWFLSEYFGRSKVQLLRPSQLLDRTTPHETNWLFVGLPTSLSKEHLRGIKYRKLVFYDSTDFDGINFEQTDQELIRSLGNVCLKNWRDRRWQTDFAMGLLPIKRPPVNNKLRFALQMNRWRERFGLKRPASQKPYDVGFVARPTGTIETNPRLRWLAEIKRSRPDWNLWGGLVGGAKWKAAFQQTPDAHTLESCWLDRKKVSFFEYFAGLRQSKVALAPRGYAPWTYRHFEAIYARCVVVSNDLSPYEFLVPFPRAGMVEVREGESVVPAVEAALEMQARNPQIVEENVAELERWLDTGAYKRQRRDTVDRFFGQFASL